MLIAVNESRVFNTIDLWLAIYYLQLQLYQNKSRPIDSMNQLCWMNCPESTDDTRGNDYLI